MFASSPTTSRFYTTSSSNAELAGCDPMMGAHMWFTFEYLLRALDWIRASIILLKNVYKPSPQLSNVGPPCKSKTTNGNASDPFRKVTKEVVNTLKLWNLVKSKRNYLVQQTSKCVVFASKVFMPLQTRGEMVYHGCKQLNKHTNKDRLLVLSSILRTTF